MKENNGLTLHHILILTGIASASLAMAACSPRPDASSLDSKPIAADNKPPPPEDKSLPPRNESTTPPESPEKNLNRVKQAELNEKLITAAENGRVDIIQSLLKQGADINGQVAHFGNTTALMEATRIAETNPGHARGVLFLLDRGADPDIKDSDGSTALIQAPYRSYDPVTRILIAKSKDVNVQTKQAGFTPLHMAASRGDHKSMMALLARGAKADPKDKQGTTPLIVAAMHPHMTRVIKSLINKGADVNARNKMGATALLEAARGSQTENMKILLAHGAGVNVREKERGGTILIIAATLGQPQSMIEQLLSKGADPNARNDKGNTALMQASLMGNVGAVKALLKHGANPHVRNKAGQTALQIAREVSKETDGAIKSRYQQIVRMLR